MPAFQENLKQAGINPGTDRYRAEMAAFASTIPDAITHNEAIRKELQDFSKVDATQEQITSRLNTVVGALNQAGQRPTSFSTTASGGVDVKATRPMDESLKALGLTPVEFLNHVNAKQGKFDEQGNFTQSLAPGEQASAIQFQAGQSKKEPGKIVTHNVPLSQFNQARSELGQKPLETFTAPGGTTTPAPSVTPSPTPEATPPGIEVGTQRTANGQTVEWDGQGWSAVQQ